MSETPWKGKLRHAPESDWGFIRDESGDLVAIVRRNLSDMQEAVARLEKRDPTQDRVDYIIAACNELAQLREALALAREALNNVANCNVVHVGSLDIDNYAEETCATALAAINRALEEQV